MTGFKDFHSTPRNDECIWLNVNCWSTLLLLLLEYNLYFLWIYLFWERTELNLGNPGFKGHFWLNWISFWLWPLDYWQYWLFIWLLVISETRKPYCIQCWVGLWFVAASFLIKALIWCLKGALLCWACVFLYFQFQKGLLGVKLLLHISHSLFL